MSKDPSGRPLRLPAFRYWLVGRSSSNLGAAITGAVLPLIAVVSLHATPAAAGVLVGIPMVTTMVIRLMASVHAERRPGRPEPLIIIDGLRILAVASVPVAWALSLLSMPVLMVQVALIGALDGAFGAYGGPFVVGLVPNEELVSANGMLQTSGNVASVAGPGFASVLLGLLTPPFVLLAEVASYLFALPALLHLRRRLPGIARPHEAQHDEKASPVKTAAAFQAPFTNRRTRGLIAALFFTTLVNGAILAELAVFMVRYLHLSPSLVALVGALGAVGGISAGILVGHLGRAVGEQASAYGAMIVMALSYVFFPLAARGLAGLWPCLLYELLSSSGGTLLIVIVFSLVQRELPQGQLARGMAAAALVPEVAQFLGAGAASLLVAVTGVLRLFDLISILGLMTIFVALVLVAWTFRRTRRGR